MLGLNAQILPLDCLWNLWNRELFPTIPAANIRRRFIQNLLFSLGIHTWIHSFAKFSFFSALSAPWTVSLFLSFYIPFCLFSLSHPIKSPGSLLSPLQPLFALVLISGLGSKASPVSDASPHLSPLHVSSKQLSALPSSLGKRFPCLPQLVLSQIPPFKQSSPLKLYFAAMPSELLCDSAAAESCHVNCV